MTQAQSATGYAWVRKPAKPSGGVPAGPPQKCRVDSLTYALNDGYEPCDPPAEPVTVTEVARAAVAPAAPVVSENKAKGRARRG